MKTYDNHPGLRWSRLSAGLTSGLQLQHELEHGRADTPQLGLGRVSHVATLTPHLLDLLPMMPAEHLTPSGAVSTGAKTKAFLAEAAEAGVEFVGAGDRETALRIADAVWRHPIARETLDMCTVRETPTYVTDPVHGALKCRTDAYDLRTGLWADLKTTGKPITVHGLAAAVRHWHYAGQASFYRRVMMLSGLAVTEQRLIFVESKAPFDVAVVDLADWKVYGDAEMEQALAVWAQVQAGDVRGVAPGLVRLELPAYLAENGEDSDAGDGLEGLS